MISRVFRSEKKVGAYLYLAENFELEDLPNELRGIVGQCTEVMQLDLSQREQLATENIETVRANLNEQGYHLQMPPRNMTGVIQYGV